MSLAPLRTLRDLLAGGAGPDSCALRVLDNGRLVHEFSRAALGSAIENAALALRAQGVRAGDAVSIAMGNTAEYVVVFLAATWMRAVAAPLNPNYKEGEFKFFMEDVDSKLLVVAAAGNPAAESAAATLGVRAVRAGGFTGVQPSRLALVPAGAVQQDDPLATPTSATWTWDPPSPTDVALYLHTSGTTARPKLVPLSHHNLCATTGHVRNTYELDEHDTLYLVMPLFHVHGLVGGLFSALCSGGTVALPATGKFSAAVFWTDVLAAQATWYTAVPTIHQILLKRLEQDAEKAARANLRFIRSCSSSLAPAVHRELESAFRAPVLEAYAMTEAAHQMTSNPLPKNGPRKPGTVGRPTNVQLAILDEHNRKLEAPGTIGQVCIRGENVTTGYINRPKANVEDFEAGWFHTGDQGFLDADGYLTLTGRLKELINRGGEKISPIEVDSVLLACPGVAEGVAFGAPSERYGEEVCAAVVPKNGADLTADEVAAFCAKHLSRHKVPTRIFVTNAVPKTATGKIQRRRVAEAFLGDTGPAKL